MVCIFLLVGTDQLRGWRMVIDFVCVRVCMCACVYVCLHAADGSGQTAACRHQCVARVAVVTLFSGIVSG